MVQQQVSSGLQILTRRNQSSSLRNNSDENILNKTYLFLLLTFDKIKNIKWCLWGAQPNISQAYVRILMFPFHLYT